MNHAMKTNPFVILLTCLLLGSLGMVPSTSRGNEKSITIRRFALVVGANNGGHKRVPLRYANSDARAFAKVLVDLGGVSKRDQLLIENSSRDKLVAAFAQMKSVLTKAKNANNKLEFVFYYSGHSNENGLLLGEEMLTYKEIKKQIDTLPAAVRIGVLDSCASGTLVRTKGGKRTAPFLVDSSTNVRGYALLTSSSADEAAQESDRVGGSYFTHYLVSGLRGAADTNRDGRVSLSESYAYAFDETLYRTESSQAGPQHPNYDFQLAGAGDLVLTDLRATNAVLLLAPELEGRIFIRDKNDRLVAEINKPSRRPVRLGIPPGKYEMTIETSGSVRRGTVTVSAREPTRITARSFQTVKKESTTPRGEIEETPEKPKQDFVNRPIAAGLVPGVSTNGSQNARNNFAINFIGVGYRLDGFEAGFLANIRTNQVNGAQFAMGYNHAAELHGVQAAFVNTIANKGRGIQAGLANIGHTTEGLQAGLFNLNRDEMRGLQAGMINSAGGIYGVQAGMVNFLAGDMDGMQAGMINYSSSLRGAQLGMINVNGFVLDGAQIGLINVSRKSKGGQIGLINIATEELTGAQVGLFNFAQNGKLSFGYWFSDTALVNTGIKMGGKYTYGIAGFSARVGRDDNWIAPLAGFGFHVDFHPFWFEVDGVCHWLQDSTSWSYAGLDLLVKARFNLGFRFAKQFSVYGGPALNNLISDFRDDVALSDGLSLYEYRDGNANYQLSLGFVFGLQWEPQWGKLNSRPTKQQSN